MEIFINNHAIDFQLEDETTVSEVIASILDWSRERDLVVSEVIVDGDGYSIHEVPDIPVREAEQMNCLIESRADIVISSIDAGIRYCEKAKNFIEDMKGSSDEEVGELKHLGDGLQWLSDVLLSVVKLVGADPDTALFVEEPLAQYIDKASAMGKEISSGENFDEIRATVNEGRDIFQHVRDIFRLILGSEEMRSLVARSIDSPDSLIQSMLDIKNVMADEIENLKNTAIAFQGGNDAEAVEKLNRFIGFIYLYTRSCYQLVPVFSLDPADIKDDDGASLEEKNLQLQDLLSEVEEVLENDDIISLSDILEYELVPLMEELTGLVDALLETFDFEN